MVCHENAAIVVQSLSGRVPFSECFDGNRHGAIPECVEAVRDLVDDRAGGDDVVIAEFEIQPPLEVFVPDVAAADDPDLVVDDQELVMHPVVESGRVAQKLRDVDEGDLSAVGKRIEEPQFDIRVSGERPDLRFATERARVVERFYRLDQSRSLPGNGLGLSIVAATASLHWGKLELADAAPGLVARIVLPRANVAVSRRENLPETLPIGTVG